MYSAQCKSHPLDSITHGRLNWKCQLNKISKEQQLQHAVSYNDVTLIMHRWKYFLVCKFLCIRIPSAGNAHTVWLHVYHFSLYIIIILCSYIIYIIGKCGHSPGTKLVILVVPYPIRIVAPADLQDPKISTSHDSCLFFQLLTEENKSYKINVSLSLVFLLINEHRFCMYIQH